MLITKDTYLNAYKPEPSPYDTPREWTDEEWHDMLERQADERKDLIFPGTVVRNGSGDVVGCIDFSRV